MQTYQKFMLTPGVQWPDGEFSPKASLQDAAEVIDREAYGETSFALMGFDPDGERWELLVTGFSHHNIVRKTRMMFGVDLVWDGLTPVEVHQPIGQVLQSSIF